MKPPYEITTNILKLVSSISEQLGAINARFLHRSSPQLRKQNQIKTIHSSLKIEGNTLSEAQITALLDNKRVVGPKKDILEVLNAIQVYEQISRFNPYSSDDFLAAHKLLMEGLIRQAGQYRTENVGIVAGSKVTHLAPPAANVHYLMEQLFQYLQKEEELILIKSCVFHYEMEFIHPFMDGNGRMGRLWQTLILIEKYPIFEFLALETLISQTQGQYYQALGASDKAGNSTIFIEYMLNIIQQSLNDLLDNSSKTLSNEDRLAYFHELGQATFTRKEYMKTFKDISSATASRDLKKGVEQGLFEKIGAKNQTIYQRKSPLN